MQDIHRVTGDDMALTQWGVSTLINQSKQAISQETPLDGGFAVFGLGYLGLPLALSFCLAGHPVVGVDISEDLVSNINAGRTHLCEDCQDRPIQSILAELIQSGRFSATADPTHALRLCRDFVVTVGIPVRDGRPDLEPLLQVTRTIAAGLKPGDLVLYRSTVIPGTIETMLVPILAESGLRPGFDFHVAYASERIAEGRAFEEFESMPVVVAGLTQNSTDRAVDMLKRVTRAPILTSSSIRTAEFTKVAENVHRDVNIAMVQELARLTEGLSIDIFEVVRLANTHTRVHLLTPGPGVGGYCIPNAFHYLEPAAEMQGIHLPLLHRARQINTGVPAVIVGIVERALGEQGKELHGARLALLGLAMKDYSSDIRQSPPLEVAQLLLSRGACVSAFDPAVLTHYPFQVGSLAGCLEGADAVLILAKQTQYDYDAIRREKHRLCAPPILVDTRNMVPRHDARHDGFLFYSI